MTKIELKLWNNWKQRKGWCRNVFTLFVTTCYWKTKIWL